MQYVVGVSLRVHGHHNVQATGAAEGSMQELDAAPEWDPCSPQGPGSWNMEARHGMSTASCAAAVSSRWAPVPSCPTRVLTTACPAMRTSLLLAVPAAARWELGQQGGGAHLHGIHGWG